MWSAGWIIDACDADLCNRHPQVNWWREKITLQDATEGYEMYQKTRKAAEVEL